MDLNALAQGALAVAGAVCTPIAVMLAKRAISLAEKKLHLTISAQTQAKLDNAVVTAAGQITAKLASGQMKLPDVALGNAHVDQAVTAFFDIAGAAADAAGITRPAVAAQIVGLVGKALGEDPTVPTVPAEVSTKPA